MTPHIAQTKRQNPTEPECIKADDGDTKTPEPIITPTIILIAEKRPSSRRNRTSPLLAVITVK